ncbi:hypothetical protein [Planktothrix sp. FACHB-1365]|uniref:hypothetical protein n=1 Tax=Planktothrix sp. FACHB-1365 TaxID=2692855 RepID=UPI0016847497|nr:hypothetical protein [Planktothrix sp. FACHB-1365]MBD2481876.1 hypothetical protein [Planktothrix sp. FACHB-1365]
MLSQLRTRYPTGSLISELLTIYQGKYVVRAVVQVEGVILTTGLAAADTVELAEDQAKKRAIQALELDTTLPKLSSSTEPLKPGVMEVKNQVVSPPPLPSEPVKIESPSPVSSGVVSSETLNVRMAESSSLTSDDWLSATYIQPKTEKQPSSSEKETQSSPAKGSKGRSASLPPIPTATTEAVSTYNDEPELSSPAPASRPLETTDFSSDIAKTDIELKRLGWTPEQGSAYLQKTYGKRSRRLLTDAELLDFLHYLESLSTPTTVEP